MIIYERKKIMKISLITVCLNSQNTINYTFNSVLNQTYKNIEHIIVDGGSEDATQELIAEYPLKSKKIFKKKMKLYESLNFAIKNVTGDYILILHSDDILNNKNTIKNVVKEINTTNCDIFLGNIVYFKSNFNEITRFYESKKFDKNDINFGLMPPHTGSVIKANIYKKNQFKEDFLIAGDFDFFNKIFYKNIYKIHYSKALIIRMKIGGISTKNLLSYLISTKEILRSLKNSKRDYNFLLVFLRFLFKINQLIFIKPKKSYYHFKIKYHYAYKEKLNFDFFIYKNFTKVLEKKKFILSAMNLAFIGSYIKNNQLKFPNLIHWPDGISSKIFDKSLIKIPGREILKKIRLPKEIRRIIVIGNLSKNSKKTLKNLYNKNIINYKVPYGQSKFIYQKLTYKIKKNDLIFITLPTPKQEELAIRMVKNYKFYKIICIGGSISMISGEEKPVPKIFNNFEFVWRLRYETKRRVLRLINTFFFVALDFIFFQQIKSLKIKFKN